MRRGQDKSRQGRKSRPNDYAVPVGLIPLASQPSAKALGYARSALRDGGSLVFVLYARVTMRFDARTRMKTDHAHG